MSDLDEIISLATELGAARAQVTVLEERLARAAGSYVIGRKKAAPPAARAKPAKKPKPAEGDRMKQIAQMVNNGLLPEDVAKSFNISRAAAVAAVWRARKAGLVDAPNGAANTT